MKEIGSIFPLSETDLNEQMVDTPVSEKEGVYLYSLCREALYDIAVSFQTSNKKALLPAYTCQTVISPFTQAGWTCHFYSIKKNLRIDNDNLIASVEKLKPSLLLVHPYYGMDLCENEIETLETACRFGVKIIHDVTQCLFSTQSLPFVDYRVGSYRKWFPIPDGGFLSTNENIDFFRHHKVWNEKFTVRQADAMYLRNIYFERKEQRIKDISIRLSKSADHVSEDSIIPHCMSSLSFSLLQKEDRKRNQSRRMDNYLFLHNHLKGNAKYRPVCDDISQVTTAPLYFTVFAEDRKSLQKLLAENRIYAPVIWPVEDKAVLINDDVRYIYEHLLAIPCDQRYDTEDMQRIVGIFDKF